MADELTVTDDGQWKPIEYDYEQQYDLLCAYAATSRAKCRRCGDLIPKGVVRIFRAQPSAAHSCHLQPLAKCERNCECECECQAKGLANYSRKL